MPRRDTPRGARHNLAIDPESFLCASSLINHLDGSI